jgi:hypothetical protein
MTAENHVSLRSRLARHPVLVALCIPALVLGTTGAARAGIGEPHNNIPIWEAPPTMLNVSVISSPGWGAFKGLFSIENAGDVDYFVFSCASDLPSDPPKYVSDVHISFTHGSGDLDIRAYTGRFGNELGVSQGVTDSEQVNIPGNIGTVVLKVYGWNNATGDYSVGFACR